MFMNEGLFEGELAVIVANHVTVESVITKDKESITKMQGGYGGLSSPLSFAPKLWKRFNTEGVG